MDISTAILILDVLNTVWAWRLMLKIGCFHACVIDGKLIVLGLIFIFSSSLSMEESSDISAVGAVLLSRKRLSVTIFFHRHRRGNGKYFWLK